MRILVGEDDEAIAEVIRIILSEEGHEILPATDEKTFLTQLKNKPQLILLDVSLGGADGGQLTKKIKKNSAQQNIPIIIVSANSQIESIAKDSGADGFLLKPFEIDQLQSLVSSYTK